MPPAAAWCRRCVQPLVENRGLTAIDELVEGGAVR